MKARYIIILLISLIFSLSNLSYAITNNEPAKANLKVTLHALGIGFAFQDSSGGIWYRSENSLLWWDEKKQTWEQTPVKILPHPNWMARPAPPWQGWLHPPCPIIGRNGSMLVVAIRDVYQDETNKEDPELKDWRQLLEYGKAQASKIGKEYWLEAWLYTEGKWCGPEKFDELLKKNKDQILRNFTLQSERCDFFDLFCREKELWTAFDNEVRVFLDNGAILTWKIPESKNNHFGFPSKFLNLVLLPDGQIWCFHDLEITMLTIQDGELHGEPMTNGTIKLPLDYIWKDPQIHVAKNGQVWMVTYPQYGSGGISLVYEDKQWKQNEDIGTFYCEDAYGGLWFLRSKRDHGGQRGYIILADSKKFNLPLPGKYPAGLVTPATKDKMIACCGNKIFTIIRSDKTDSGWLVEKEFSPDLEKNWFMDKAFIDGQGTIIIGTCTAKESLK
jgi:hypothetical protein